MRHSKKFYSIRKMIEKILKVRLNPVETKEWHVYQGYVLRNGFQDPKIFVQLKEMPEEKKAIFEIVRFQNGYHKDTYKDIWDTGIPVKLDLEKDTERDVRKKLNSMLVREVSMFLGSIRTRSELAGFLNYIQGKIL